MIEVGWSGQSGKQVGWLGGCPWHSGDLYQRLATPFDVTFVPRNDGDALRAAVTTSTAAVIIEPVQGMAGAFDFAPPFMRAVQQRCAESGAFLIMDEVQTGVGRLGASFGAAHFDQTL